MTVKFHPLSEKLELKYDFFRGTVDDHPASILDALQRRLGMESVSDSKGPPQYDYSRGLWRHAGDVEKKAADVVVSFGGNSDAPPSVLGRGAIAHDLVPAVQAFWPDQTRVTRIDSCLDLSDGFDMIEAEMQRLHHEQHIKRMRYGVPETGQTFTLGSEKSPTKTRVYQKGLQMLPSMAPEERGAYYGWTRVETEYRPRSADKAKAIGLSPLDVWGTAKFSTYLIGWIAQQNPTPLDRKPRMDRTALERFQFAMRMYAKTIKEIGPDEAHRVLDQILNDELGPLTRDEISPRAPAQSTSVVH